MTTPYPQGFSDIQNGEAVSAGVTNRPLNTLRQRTTSLDEKISNALIGSTTVARDVPLAGETTVGQAVYRDNDGVYRPALSALEPGSDGVSLQPAISSYVWGVVQYKHTNVLGNVVYNGHLTIREDDLADSIIGGAAVTGPLYLSGTPGKKGFLVQQSPPFGFIVCVVTGPHGADTDGTDLYQMYVNPGWKNPLEGHIHYHARLSNLETPTDWGTPSVDAPVGAVYEYVIASDTVLSKIWPPIPIGAVHFDIDGVAQDLINEGVITINADGIFWNDAVNDPSDYTYIDFYFTRMTFKTGSALVTSLTPANATITIQDLNGDDATTGDLVIKANPVLDDGEVDDTSHLAFKSIDVNGVTLNKGPVVVGVKSSNTDTLVITGGTALSAPNADYLAGLLTLTVSDPSTREGPVEFNALDNVSLETSGDIYYLELASGLDSSIRGRFCVPTIAPAGNLDIQIRFVVLALANGTMPDLALEYLVLNPTTTPATITTTLASLGNLALSAAGAVTTGQAFEKLSPAFTATAGDIVIFRIIRTDADGYGGSIGLIDQRWLATPE